MPEESKTNNMKKIKLIETVPDDLEERINSAEDKINELPKIYALKTDLTMGLNEIKDRLNHINDKLDQLILSKINEKT